MNTKAYLEICWKIFFAFTPLKNDNSKVIFYCLVKIKDKWFLWRFISAEVL